MLRTCKSFATSGVDSVLALGLDATLAGLAVLDGKLEAAAELSPTFWLFLLAIAFASRSLRRSWALLVEDGRAGPAVRQPYPTAKFEDCSLYC